MSDQDLTNAANLIRLHTVLELLQKVVPASHASVSEYEHRVVLRTVRRWASALERDDERLPYRPQSRA